VRAEECSQGLEGLRRRCRCCVVRQCQISDLLAPNHEGMLGPVHWYPQYPKPPNATEQRIAATLLARRPPSPRTHWIRQPPDG
jgi:hypothetical protein